MQHSKRIPSSSTFPERMENHEDKQWHNLSFDHKTTTSMGLLVPLAVKEVYPGELAKLGSELRMRFAPLFLPIMHQCYYTLDWYYVNNQQLWPSEATVGNNEGWQNFIKQDPVTGGTNWPYFEYKRADAVFTDGVLNYMGFNAPPGAGTLILQTQVSALPVAAYAKIYDEYYRNDQIQTSNFYFLAQGDNTADIEAMLPNLRVKRRNWPRDYYTSATPTPQQGESVLIPSFATDPETGLYLPQELYKLDGTNVVDGTALQSSASNPRTVEIDGSQAVIQLSSTIRDFRYAAQMQEYLERSLRAGDRYNDWVHANFKWNPNPLFIDRPVWIGGSSGPVVISDVMSTAESGAQKVGSYAGKALVSGGTPQYTYQVPDYGFCMAILTVYPKASYYSGLENMWTRDHPLDYMFEQFALIGDQPIRNKEVWFSWYDADIAWNDEIFGYLPQYAQFRYSNDIVSGQMRTLWESFHLGRKFAAASDVVLNSGFITCTPDIGRVFDVDAEAGENEIYIHAYIDIQILRRLPKNALPSL